MSTGDSERLSMTPPPETSTVIVSMLSAPTVPSRSLEPIVGVTAMPRSRLRSRSDIVMELCVPQLVMKDMTRASIRIALERPSEMTVNCRLSLSSIGFLLARGG